jgi:hypothetical protein
MSKETAPAYSVVNGKLMHMGAVARIEVTPAEAAKRLNGVSEALRDIGHTSDDAVTRDKARTAAARVEGRS